MKGFILSCKSAPRNIQKARLRPARTAISCTLGHIILALYAEEFWSLLNAEDIQQLADNAMLIRLDPYLEILSAGLGMPHPVRVPGQLELFLIRLVSSRRAQTATVHDSGEAGAMQPRKSA